MKWRKLLKGCAFAALGVGVLVVLAAVFGARALIGPLNRSMASQEELLTQLSGAEAYTPPLDGFIPPERMEKFLAVEERLQPWCATFEAFDAQLERMDQLGRGEEPPPAIDALKEAARTVKSAAGMARSMGELFDARNLALLEAGMGLGEYAYIALVAYRDHWMTRVGDRGFQSAPLGGRLRSRFRAMLARQRRDLEAMGIEADVIAAEIAALDADPERTPWCDGLPAALASSVMPYRSRLAATYCESLGGMRLAEPQSEHGIGVRVD